MARANMKPWSSGSRAIVAPAARALSAISFTRSLLSKERARSTSVDFLASTISFFVKSLKRAGVMSMAKMVSEICKQAASSLVNCGLNVNPRALKNSMDFGRSETQRLMKTWVFMEEG